MSEQPTALRLADALDADRWHPGCRKLAAAELRRLHAENEDLRRTLAASCDEERNQLWEAGPGGGCARALSAEFRCAELLEALRPFTASTLTYNGAIIGLMREDFDRARAAIAKATGEPA